MFILVSGIATLVQYTTFSNLKPGHGTVISKEIYGPREYYGGKGGMTCYTLPTTYILNLDINGEKHQLATDKGFFDYVCDEMLVPVFYQTVPCSGKMRIYNSAYPFDLEKVRVHL